MPKLSITPWSAGGPNDFVTYQVTLLIPQLSQQILGMDGFGQDFKFVALGASLFQQVRGGSLAREQQDLAAGKDFADSNRRLNAIHVRHDDVADNQVRTAIAGAFHRGGAGINRGSVKSILVQDDRQ